jgi:small subunit ribosomal protein S2
MEATETVKALFEAGVHFGYSKTRRHPSTVPFVFTTKNRNDIINLEKTAELLARAQETMKGLGAGGKQILYVGTKPEVKKVMREAAERIDMPYVDQRWVGGTLTNFSEIRRRVDRLMDLEYRKEHGELIYQTKKEKLMLEREIEKLKKNFGGLTSLKRMPEMLVVLDSGAESIAVAEANRMNVPVLALASTDCDITKVTFPIVGNDTAITSVKLIMDTLTSAYDAGKE